VNATPPNAEVGPPPETGVVLEPSDDGDEARGSFRVYAAVVLSFVLWVSLMLLLQKAFS
jgi:hypothetical protein